MIKLSDIESKVFEIEISEGDVRRYDLIDLVKSLSEAFNLNDLQEINPTEIISKIDKIKEIFKIEELTSSQSMSLLEHAMIAFEEAFVDVKDIVNDDIKKKELENVQSLSDSTD